MPYTAILIDLDGTLLDTLEDLADAANRVMTARNLPAHPVDAYRYFVGDGIVTLMTRVLPEGMRDPETVDACVEAFREAYDRTWRTKTEPYPGVEAMLEGLTARGLTLAVLSNKPHEFTRRCVAELLPEARFERVLGQRKEVPKKPDPAGAIEVAEGLGIPTSEFLFIGDTAVDMETAVAAGMHPVGVLWGFRPAEELKAAGARRLIEHPADVFELFD